MFKLEIHKNAEKNDFINANTALNVQTLCTSLEMLIVCNSFYFYKRKKYLKFSLILFKYFHTSRDPFKCVSIHL